MLSRVGIMRIEKDYGTDPNTNSGACWGKGITYVYTPLLNIPDGNVMVERG
jgi:hypothetical protein